MTKRKETKEKSPAVCRALPKIWGHSNFGGDKTRYAQTVSPLIEILAPFLTPDTMPEATDPLTRIISLVLSHVRKSPLSFIHLDAVALAKDNAYDDTLI